MGRGSVKGPDASGGALLILIYKGVWNGYQHIPARSGSRINTATTTGRLSHNLKCEYELREYMAGSPWPEHTTVTLPAPNSDKI